MNDIFEQVLAELHDERCTALKDSDFYSSCGMRDLAAVHRARSEGVEKAITRVRQIQLRQLSAAQEKEVAHAG